MTYLPEWRQKATRRRLELRDQIITADCLKSLKSQIWPKIFSLYFLCCFSNLQDDARKLLETYFAAQPDHDPDSTIPDDGDRKILRLLWKHAEATKPDNILWDILGFDQPQDDPIADCANRRPIEDSYDPHQWRTTEDPRVHADCAILLCRRSAEEGADPGRIVEAFEVLDRMFVPLRGKKLMLCDEDQPYFDTISLYLSLAVRLGALDKARRAVTLAADASFFGLLTDLLSNPLLYELYFGKGGVSRPDTEPLMTEAEASLAVREITEALIQRKHNGPQEPLHGVGWPELLQRFSEAAFKLHKKEYAEIQDPPQQPSDILLPPISQEKLAEVEEKLGPLPADLREMVQIANGFRGAWHLFGGGFAGVDKLEPTPSGDYEIWLGVKQEPRVVARQVIRPDGTIETVETRVFEVGLGPMEGMKAGPVWISWGTEENDDFEHIICPPKTWKKFVESGRAAYGGEYRVTCHAHWIDDDDGWTSMRDWIASETAAMERELKIKAEVGDDGEQDEDEDEDDHEDEDE